MKLGDTFEFEGKAAIVCKVNADGTGNLAVFDENGDIKHATGVMLPAAPKPVPAVMQKPNPSPHSASTTSKP